MFTNAIRAGRWNVRYSVSDFMATICKVLGIDCTKTIDTPGGRPVRLVEKGANPVAELFA
jgi:hypothetical protein